MVKLKNIFSLLRVRQRFCIVLVMVSFTLLLINSCKKYPEDDRRYWFKSPVCRLNNPAGKWQIYRYYINGSDSTNNLMGKYNPSYSLIFLVDHKYKTGVYFTGIYFISRIGTGTMELVSNKNKLNITTSFKNGYYNLFINTSTDWDVKKLT